jgi:hypothetical protein
MTGIEQIDKWIQYAKFKPLSRQRPIREFDWYVRGCGGPVVEFSCNLIAFNPAEPYVSAALVGVEWDPAPGSLDYQGPRDSGDPICQRLSRLYRAVFEEFPGVDPDCCVIGGEIKPNDDYIFAGKFKRRRRHDGDRWPHPDRPDLTNKYEVAYIGILCWDRAYAAVRSDADMDCVLRYVRRGCRLIGRVLAEQPWLVFPELYPLALYRP